MFTARSYGLICTAAIPTTHAVRALARLVREHGEGVRETALGCALAARAAVDGDTATPVTAFGGGFMLRGPDGRFTGAWHERRGCDETVDLDPSAAALLMFGCGRK
jgi:hypothetical protein